MSKLVTIGLVAAILFAGLAAAVGEEKSPAPVAKPEKTEVPALHEAVEEILTRVLGAKKGLRLGIPDSGVAKVAPGSVNILGHIYLPLAGSGFEPKGGGKGTVHLTAVDDDGLVDELRVSLLAGKYDRKALLGFLRKKVVEVGIRDFDCDHESGEWIWWGTCGTDRSLWVGLGEKIVVLEFSED